MTPAEAMALQPPRHRRPQWFLMPPSVADWLLPDDRAALWLPADMSAADELAGWDQLAAWDALAGRLLRESLFGDGETRALRKDAEAVAAVAEQLAVFLGARG